MGRDVKECFEIHTAAPQTGVTFGTLFLVQDRRDDPQRTDRWFFEAQLRFDNEDDARAFFEAAKRAFPESR